MSKKMMLSVVGFAAALSLSCAYAAAVSPPKAAAGIVVHADQPGAKINKNVYGQFSEHLGTGIYGGIYVGKNSSIPNTDGFRNDVIAALKALHVPMVRWPGGCFADEYHWRDGIGPQAQRPVGVNHNWGGVPENNAFGTHEFFEFVDMIGADAYVNANVGTGSVQEMAAWLEYMTGNQDTTLVKMRKANGRDKPWKVSIFAIGNEMWGCGGNMSAAHYTDVFKQYATFVRTTPDARPELLASGSHDFDTSFTETLMKNAMPVGMNAISHHWYTINGDKWGDMGPATGFGEDQWISHVANTLKIDGIIKQNVAIMDKYDPAKKVGFYVDEWGTWYKPAPGSNPGFLVQQNTIRDAVIAAANFNIFHKYADRVRMTAIAQTVNVLQAMILTDGGKMVLTPTYYAYQMYIPFQNATMLPVDLKTGNYAYGKKSVPQLSVSAAKTVDGDIVVGLVNLDPHQAVPVRIALDGAKAGEVHGTVLTADAMDAHNTFDKPNTVHPSAYNDATVAQGVLTATLPPKSVVVLHVK
jgi:alpha-L-arabinofuranosidase